MVAGRFGRLTESDLLRFSTAAALSNCSVGSLFLRPRDLRSLVGSTSRGGDPISTSGTGTGMPMVLPLSPSGLSPFFLAGGASRASSKGRKMGVTSPKSSFSRLCTRVCFGRFSRSSERSAWGREAEEEEEGEGAAEEAEEGGCRVWVHSMSR